jgi:hypothetical protein
MIVIGKVGCNLSRKLNRRSNGVGPPCLCPKIKTPLGEPKGESFFIRNPLARATVYFFFLAGAFLATFFAAFLVAFFIE